MSKYRPWNLRRKLKHDWLGLKWSNHSNSSTNKIRLLTSSVRWLESSTDVFAVTSMSKTRWTPWNTLAAKSMQSRQLTWKRSYESVSRLWLSSNKRPGTFKSRSTSLLRLKRKLGKLNLLKKILNQKRLKTFKQSQQKEHPLTKGRRDSSKTEVNYRSKNKLIKV